MGESPPQDPPAANGAGGAGASAAASTEAAEAPPAEKAEKKGESDPLFNPPGLKTRKTMMGLAPAPHLGGAESRERETAEARKQRVLARIAALDASARARGPTGARTDSAAPAAPGSVAPAAAPGSVAPAAPGSVAPAPPGSVAPAAGPVAPRPGSSRPPQAAANASRSSRPPAGETIKGSDPSQGGAETQVLPTAAAAGRQAQKLQSGTLIMTPGVPLALPKDHISEGNLKTVAMNTAPKPQPQTGPPPDVSMPPRPPYGSAPDPRVMNADMEKRGPSTERLLRPATPAEPAAPTTALALRPFGALQAQPTPQQLDPRLVLMREPHSQRAVSFRLLRDGLLAKSMPRVVAVTSATPKEGKTTCAVNLALALAEQAGTRVLLLDANFAEPELEAIFMVSRLPSIAPPAASSWLAPYKIVEARPTLHVGGIVLAPGEPRPSFDQPRFDAMLDRLVRVAYDYIIVDTQALLGTPSVIQLISSVDSALLAVRSGGTTTRHLRQAVEQIPKAKALGIALVDAH